MNKSIILLCVAALPLVASADQLTPAGALSRAMSSTMLKAPGHAAYDASNVAFTATNNGANTLYVINASDDRGFVVLAGDDIAEPLLGYSTSGAFDAQDMPENLRWWLEQYNLEIGAAIDAGISTQAMAPSRRPDIEPLIVSRWGQDAPYNDMCPELNGERTVTGCVATAMAQIMYYHQWPLQGVGSHSYESPNCGTQSVDFSAITYKWDQMTPTYSSASTDASKSAVAELMYSVGVAMDMDYDVASAGGSGAMPFYSPRALIDNFNYDKGAYYADRDYFSTPEWENLVYGELISGRPVLYSGHGDGGGHTFVCDGYADGRFHMNWGWNGFYDGYFLLSALVPAGQGIGGNESGFSAGQSVVVGIQKPTAENKPAFHCCTDGTFTPYNMSNDRTAYVKFISMVNDTDYSYFFNCTYQTLTFYMGVKLTDAAGNEYFAKDYYYELRSLYGTPDYYVRLNEVPNGIYSVTPMCYNADADAWSEIWVPLDKKRMLTAKITDTKVDFTLADNDYKVDVTDFALGTPIYQDCAFKVTATLNSDCDYMSMVRLCLYEKGMGTPLLWSPDFMITVNAGETTPMDICTTLSKKNTGEPNPAYGDYELQIVDDKFNPISDRIAVSYQANPGAGSLSAVSLSVVNGPTAPADDIRIHGEVKCASGYYAESLYIYLFDLSGPLAEIFETPTLFIPAGQTAEFDIVGSYLGYDPNKDYALAYVFGNDIDYSHVVYLTLSDPIETPGEANLLTFVTSELTASTQANIVAHTDDGWAANNIELVDAVQFYNPVDFEAKKVTYTRTFDNTEWAALYLPFELNYSEWGSYAKSVIEYTGTEKIDEHTILTFATIPTGATLEANHPYIFCPVAAGTQVLTVTNKTVCATPETDACINPTGADYALYGQYEVKDDMSTTQAYGLYNGNFYRAKDNSVSLKPFRVYLLPNSNQLLAPSRLPMVVDSSASAIDIIVDAESGDNVLYDLQGRRVNNPTPGFYILNGQKIRITNSK